MVQFFYIVSREEWKSLECWNNKFFKYQKMLFVVAIAIRLLLVLETFEKGHFSTNGLCSLV